MKPFTEYGLWWDPRDPEREWTGRLRVNARGRMRLTATLPMGERGLSMPSDGSYPVIHGVATSGRQFTLFDCFNRSTTMSFFGVPSPTRIHVNALVSGFHCENPDPSILGASVGFRHLTEWWGRSGIHSDPALRPPDVAVSYSPAKPLVIHDDGGIKVSIRPGPRWSIGRHRFRLSESVSFEIDAEHPTPLSSFQRLSSAFGDFLSVVCLTHCTQERLTLVPATGDGEQKRLGEFHAVPIYKAKSSRRPHQMFFRHLDAEERTPAILASWLSQADKLHDARTLYMAGVYGGGFIETKLLLLTQAAEAFHRQYYAGRYMDQQAFEASVLAPMSASVPAGVDNSLRQSIVARLRFANEYSQRRRIRELFDAHEAALSILVADPKQFIEPIIDHRNDFTHFPPHASELRNSGDKRNPSKVLLYNWLLRLLLEACFLQTMGLTPTEVASCVERSDTYRQMSKRFR